MIARKALTRGCAYHFVFGFYAFTVSNSVLFFSTLPELVFPISILFPAEKRNKGILSSSDLELWPMTLTYEHDLDRVKIEPPCQIYRSKVIVSSKFILRTHTHQTDCTIWTIKWSVTIHLVKRCRESISNMTVLRRACLTYVREHTDSAVKRWSFAVVHPSVPAACTTFDRSRARYMGRARERVRAVNTDRRPSLIGLGRGRRRRRNGPGTAEPGRGRVRGKCH